MSFEPEYPDTLELIGPQGGRVKIADFLMGEPIEVDGLKYKTITITTPLRNIKPGDFLTAFFRFCLERETLGEAAAAFPDRLDYPRLFDRRHVR